jgi:hypothetical protein
MLCGLGCASPFDYVDDIGLWFGLVLLIMLAVLLVLIIVSCWHALFLLVIGGLMSSWVWLPTIISSCWETVSKVSRNDPLSLLCVLVCVGFVLSSPQFVLVILISLNLSGTNRLQRFIGKN